MWNSTLTIPCTHSSSTSRIEKINQKKMLTTKNRSYPFITWFRTFPSASPLSLFHFPASASFAICYSLHLQKKDNKNKKIIIADARYSNNKELASVQPKSIRDYAPGEGSIAQFHHDKVSKCSCYMHQRWIEGNATASSYEISSVERHFSTCQKTE